LSIKYKKGRTNRFVDYLNQPPIETLTIVINSYGHETSRCSQLYDNDPNFTITYQTLSVGKLVLEFYLLDELLCHLGHIYFPSSEHEKIICEEHYRQVVGHFDIEIVVVLQKYFISQRYNRIETCISDHALPMPSQNLPSRSRGCTLLYIP
jgi:hypothetical protein